MVDSDNLTTFQVRSTSLQSADVQDIPLGVDDDRRLTRRILRSAVVDNQKNPAANVEICLRHQRRKTIQDAWSDVSPFDLRGLKSGDEVRLSLDSRETLDLYKAMTNLYATSGLGIPRGRKNVLVVDATSEIDSSVRQVIQRLVSEQGGDFWQMVGQLDPEALKNVALSKMHEERRVAVEEFAREYNSQQWSEPEWMQFFLNNDWIFGLGLAYQFLDVVQAEANYGGTDVTGRGGQRGDALMATKAALGFTVLVDIKKPQTLLVTDRAYRNKVFALGPDLTGGVSQLQSNCLTWELEGARKPENIEELAMRGVHTHAPKAILVIGDTGQLVPNRDKRATFELFRRHLRNPEIVTFDELLARARHMVGAKE